MIKFFIIRSLACLFLSSVLFSVTASESPDASSVIKHDFSKLLQMAGLNLHSPEQFETLPAANNSVLDYEYALKHLDKKLAVRYAIRPIDMVQIDYEDPHNAAPEPNHLFPMLFQSLISDFSRGGNSPTTEYTTEDARKKFNADWAAVAVMDVVPEFSQEYSQLLLLALHKNNASDAYVMILFDDYASVKPEINQVLVSLKYK